MIKDQTIVITGASRRLGLLLCEKFSANDCRVFAITRKPSEELKCLVKSHALELIQVASYESEPVQQAVEKINSGVQKIHTLVHNVSAFSKDEQCYSEQAYQQFFRLHMGLPAQLNMAFKEKLYDTSEPGNIIHITDIFADNPSAAHVLYCSTKAGLENLSKGFAKKFAPGIRVNAIQPGPVKFLPTHSEAIKKQVLNETLLQREGGFLPIFQAVCSVVENSYMTGASIKVDGGRALGRG